jgi:ABC-type multidrug transport system fused ATPase/permease subunit
MDEPTANLDSATDDAVQRVVRQEFKTATVLTIAHRLGTVIDYDRVLVMDHGAVVEFGAASELLEREPAGHLKRMVAAHGPAAAAALQRKAKAAEAEAASQKKQRGPAVGSGSGM